MKRKLSSMALIPLTAAVFCLVLLLPKSAWAAGDIVINSTNFPDPLFQEFVSRYVDEDEDGLVSSTEAAAVDVINLFYADIQGGVKNVKGIEYFPNLKTLYAGNQSLTSINLTANQKLETLDCSNNQLASLFVLNCAQLKDLDCSENKLTELDLSDCTQLKELDCSENELTSLDLSGCTKLEILRCAVNQLNSLNILNCTLLKEVSCGENQLSSLNVKNCTVLRELFCQNNGLTSLNVKNCTALEELDCEENRLTSLGIQNCKALVKLDCSGNKLTGLDNAGCTKLTDLDCSNNQMTALYVNTNTALTYLNCSNNQLPGLDVSKNKKLTDFYIYGNPGKKYNIYDTKTALWLRSGLGSSIVAGGTDYYDTPTPGTVGYYDTYEEEDDGHVYIAYERFAGFDEDDVIIALDTPSINASNTASGIKVSWNKVKSAAEYEVWRAPKGSTNYKLLKTVAGTSYTDKTAAAGNSYAYRICAKNGVIYSKNAAVSITRNNENPFTDVSENDSYYNAVIWAVNNGITSGTSSTTFSPNADCTRYQFAVMLYKLAGKPAASGTLPFKDVKKTDSYYNAVLWAYMNGIISGTSATTFSPMAGITRYQVVQMLYKFVGKPPVSGTNPFKDVSTKASYYNAVLWAVQNGITKGTDATHFSPNAVCKRYQLVVFLYKFNNIYHIK